MFLNKNELCCFFVNIVAYDGDPTNELLFQVLIANDLLQYN